MSSFWEDWCTHARLGVVKTGAAPRPGSPPGRCAPVIVNTANHPPPPYPARQGPRAVGSQLADRNPPVPEPSTLQGCAGFPRSPVPADTCSTYNTGQTEIRPPPGSRPQLNCPISTALPCRSVGKLLVRRSPAAAVRPSAFVRPSCRRCSPPDQNPRSPPRVRAQGPGPAPSAPSRPARAARRGPWRCAPRGRRLLSLSNLGF